jgi:hypothetical protein
VSLILADVIDGFVLDGHSCPGWRLRW